MIALLALAAVTAPIICEAVWNDAARARDIPVRVTLPAGAQRLPVVVWSPGLGGDQRGGAVWAADWANAGLAVVQLAHAGSDAVVYRAGGTPEERRARVVAGSSPEQLIARIADVRFALSELARRPAEGACDLTRIDTARAAIAGHSMGAWVAQGIAGQRFGPDDHALLRDQRFRAAVALSPTAVPGSTGFRRVGIPFMVVTGTLDGTTALAGPTERAAALAARVAPFESMAADGHKCLLVIAGGEHMMFAGNRGATETVAAHVDALAGAATTDFLRAALQADPPLRITPAPLPLAAGDVYRCK